ncbi:DUF2917 domain-containing protein [Massilia sp. W12]|uniref:DUF2917 domain-containing protein n=1 Tax=Massilia sp. W12 TaxID=3126507 RepID=UPI0030CB7921
MRTLYANDSLVLLSGQCLSRRSASPLWLRAECGRLWLTASGLNEDIWLQPGESVILPPNPHLVAQTDAGMARLDALSPQALQYSGQTLSMLRALFPDGKTLRTKAWLFPYILRRDASYNTGHVTSAANGAA